MDLDKPYLVTYDKDIEVCGVIVGSERTYAWFETEEEMDEFLEEENIIPIEKLLIVEVERL